MPTLKKRLMVLFLKRNPLSADAIVVTQKDIVKIRKLNIKDANILSLKIEIEITKGVDLYKAAIDRVFKSNVRN